MVFVQNTERFIHPVGYGYSKRTCEDVASWFLNKFFPRHKIYVEIVHRGLKREHVYGYGVMFWVKPIAPESS
jgi:hypothetical protein